MKATIIGGSGLIGSGVAAVLEGRPVLKGKSAIVLCTGGNVDPEIVARIFD